MQPDRNVSEHPFQSASIDLCDALPSTARRICCSVLEPSSLSAFVACRLVALDKRPGVRPRHRRNGKTERQFYPPSEMTSRSGLRMANFDFGLGLAEIYGIRVTTSLHERKVCGIP